MDARHRLYRRSLLGASMEIGAFLLSLIFLTGCAGLTSTIQPPPGLEPNWQPGHYISTVEPRLVRHLDLWIFRYVKWEGREEFTSWSIQPLGTAQRDESKQPCFQVYWGVKIDGTETKKLQAPGALGEGGLAALLMKLWDYVYTPEEQWAIRWRNAGCGYPTIWDMGGS
jgi:hypothetical protein